MKNPHSSSYHPDTSFIATLTRCAGTWLEQLPTPAEQGQIDTAAKQLREQRRIATEFYRDATAADVFSITLFRDETFAPLHFGERLVTEILAVEGEPPVVDGDNEEAFSSYLHRAVVSIAHARVRRALAAQLRRYLPHYVERGQWKEAVAIDNNAFRTSLGNEVTPFLAQMALEGLAHWYEEHETDDADPTVL